MNTGPSSAPQTYRSKQWEGQVVDGLFPLRQYLGGDETGAVFLTEYEGQRAAIKVVTAAGRSAEQRLWHWRLASKVSHPHLIRLFKVGRSQLDGAAIAYVVMEYAEENLGQVLAERPLTTLEAKEMLGPALEAIACVHRDGFIHGRLKPANIMAVNDCLKLSSDNLRRIGDSDDLPALQGAYRPPEIAAGGKLSPAGDIWALGVTLVEALTQRQPAWTGTEAELVLPDGIPEPFLDIVRHCFRPYAQERWTAAEIAGRLEAQAPAPKKSRAWWYAVPAVVLVIAILAVWMGRRSTDTSRPSATTASEVASSNPPTSSSSSQPASAAPSTVQPLSQPSSALSARGPAPEANTSQRTASPSSSSHPASPERASPASGVSSPPATSAQASEPGPPVVAPEQLSTSATPATAPAGAASPEVVNQVMPDVLAKARRSIQGRVNVGVRVHADAYGTVKEATLEPPPASRYFSGVTLQAVRRWKFRPVRAGEVYVPQEWIVRFEFTRSDTKVVVERVAP